MPRLFPLFLVELRHLLNMKLRSTREETQSKQDLGFTILPSINITEVLVSYKTVTEEVL